MKITALANIWISQKEPKEEEYNRNKKTAEKEREKENNRNKKTEETRI